MNPCLKSMLFHISASLLYLYHSLEYDFSVLQWTLANPNRGVPIHGISVPISEFVRISEVIHLYGEFCSESLKNIQKARYSDPY